MTDRTSVWLSVCLLATSVACLITSCALHDSPPEERPPLLTGVNWRSIADLPPPALRAATLTSTAVTGVAVVHQPKTTCQVAGGGPVVLPVGRPIAGQPFRVQWSTKPTVPPEPPARDTWLLWSQRPATPAKLDQWGYSDCWLMVNPDNAMAPQPGTILTREGGRTFLDWTPPIWSAGQQLWLQLILVEPNAPGRFVLSPALELVVGSQ